MFHLLGDLLIAGVPLAIPFLLAALGEIVAERSGIINVGIEGMMLAGALAGFGISFAFHSIFFGIVFSAIAGIVLASIFSVFTIQLNGDQVVVGTAINILSLGITGVFARAFLPDTSLSAPSLHNIPVPWLSSLPYVGSPLFNQNGLAYLAWLAVPLISTFLYRTRAGLRLRAVGEFPQAAEASGANVARVRMLSVLFGGALAGMAGAYLSLGYANGFVENMSGGRGFIALAVVIVGRWNPWGALAAALMFGVASAMQFRFQATALHVPYQLFLALPYLLTLAALLFRSGPKTSPPAALGQPFIRA